MLQVEGKPPQPLPGLTTAQIDLVWERPEIRLLRAARRKQGLPALRVARDDPRSRK